MTNTNETWTRAHDLALIYIALAYGTDYNLADEELAVLTESLEGWEHQFPMDNVPEVVMEALAVFMEEHAADEVTRSMQALKALLSREERCRALEEVVRIAEADGVLLSSEQGLINMLADVWEIKATAQNLLEASTATVQDRPTWSLMHDITLMYLVVAHTADNNLTNEELTAIQERLHDWEPDLDREDIRTVVRETLQHYSTGPDESTLKQSISAVRDVLPLVQRLAVLNDLVFIAEADGAMQDTERTMIDSLARHWKVDIRLNGHARKEA